MSSDTPWGRMSLKAAGITLIDCDHRTPPAIDQGYPYIAIPQLKDGHIDLQGVRKISREDFLEWTKKLRPQADDVIIVRRCSSGDSAVIPVGLDCAIGQNLVVLRSDGVTVHPKFLRWLVRSPDWWDQVSKYINVGAVFDSLKCKEIPHFELTIPPLEHQREIAALLGGLDDRITLLRETNTLLEQIAQTIFKSWFVDFDPVRAKQEGRIPKGMDEETAALFPDSFEESALGMVPRGWKVMPLGEAVETVGGATPDTKNVDYWSPEEYSWTSPKDLSGLRAPVLLRTERKISAKGLARVSSGLLPEGTLLMSSRAPIGYLAVTNTPMAINQGYIAMPPGGTLPPSYMLFWCQQNMEEIKNRANGSTFMEISKKAFRPIPVLVPDKALLGEVASTSNSMLKRIINNEEQAQILADLRDTLLPRLISGKLRLPEVNLENVLS